MIDLTKNYKKIILNNGLTLILYKIKEVQSVYIFAYVKSSNLYATEKQIGIAHFLEHLSFCATEKCKTRKSISQKLYDIGAYANAQTNFLNTNYWIKFPSIKLNESINIFHQLIFRSVITEKEVEYERKIILNEFNDFLNNINSAFSLQIQKNRFKNLSSYQSKAIGNDKNIKEIKTKDIKIWKKKFVNPNNTIISIAGNFSEDDLINNIKETFGKEEKGNKINFPKFDQSNYSNFSLYHKEREGNQVWFDLNWPTFGWLESTKHSELVLAILNYVLGVGPLSRLNLKLREKENLCYYVKSYSILYPSLGYLGISASVAEKDLLIALKHIKNILTEICKNGITEKEFETTKKYFKLQNLMSFETPESIAGYFAQQIFDYGEIWTNEDYINERNKITLEEVEKMANLVFDMNKLNINLLGNIPSKTKDEISKVFKN